MKLIVLYAQRMPTPFEPKFCPKLGTTHGLDEGIATDDVNEQMCSWE
jgi:hypothetical protein